MAAALGQDPDFAVVGTFPTSGPDAYQAALHYRPDVVLVDQWLPDMDGIATTRMIVSALPDCKVTILSGFYGRPALEQAFRAGAIGYLPKGCRLHQVGEAIREASAQNGKGSMVLVREVEELAEKLERRSQLTEQMVSALSTLTPRETQVLNLLSQGLIRNEIAKELSVSSDTVRTHIRNISKKSGGRTQAQVLHHARRLGFIRM